MKPKRKIVERNPPGDPTLLKKASTQANLVRGLAALDSIWKRGVIPRDLEQHFYLTWYGFENGNVRRLSRTLGLHRNTLVMNFRLKVKYPSTIRLRRFWFKIGKSHPGKSFQERLFRFYNRAVKTPWLLNRENEALADLWLMGVDRKTIRAHYVLWALREGMDLFEISGKMRKGTRSVHRFRVYATKTGSPGKKWLEPLKAPKAEWFPQGKRGRRRRGL